MWCSQQGTWQKYQEGKWQEVDPTDLLRLTKHEGQPWLVLFNLMVLLAAATVVLFVCVCVVAVCLCVFVSGCVSVCLWACVCLSHASLLLHTQCDAECRKRYHFHSARKTGVLRVRKYLNEILLDQLPVLADVQVRCQCLCLLNSPSCCCELRVLITVPLPSLQQRYMDELTLMDVPEPTQFAKSSALILEQVSVFAWCMLLRVSMQADTLEGLPQEPAVREKLVEGQDWDKIAAAQLAVLPDSKDDKDIKACVLLSTRVQCRDNC